MIIKSAKIQEIFQLPEIETRRLKESVRRNMKRFEGEDFMFILTKDEVSRSQIATLNKGRGGNIKYLPFAFTELGIAMLSSVLNSDYAIDVNKKIMRAFVAIRKYASNYAELKHELEMYMNETNRKIDDIYTLLDSLSEYKKELEKPSNPIGFVLKNNNN